jgi:hypothetical protein
VSKPRRKRRGASNLPAIRRGEIERHARDIGVADTEDFWRWLVAWCWHNEQNGRDPAGALILAAERMGGILTQAEAITILEQADDMRQQRGADNLAKFLGVTYPQRLKLGITTIGSIDVSKRARELLRKRKKRLHAERKRRAKGSKPRAAYLEENSIMRTKPWEAEGISRRTWYRRKRGTSPSPAIPPLTKWHKSVPSPLSSPVHTPVPPERKQGGIRGGACPPSTEQTASPASLAREGLCGCRHNGPLPSDLSQKEAAE